MAKIQLELVGQLNQYETEYRQGPNHYLYNSKERKVYLWAIGKNKTMIARNVDLEAAKKLMK